MLVPKRKINSWKMISEHGDFAEMERISGIKRQQLSRAFNRRTMAEKTFFVFQDYYEGKMLLKKQKSVTKVTTTE